jgi:ParB family chromosome partitioning protein
MTQEAISAAVGKDRATIANVTRLLKLPQEVQNEVAAGRLTMGHARALLALPVESDQRRVARDVISRGLSVRETETVVRREADTVKTARATVEAAAPKVDVHTRAAEDKLRLTFGTRVRIVRSGPKGRIEIDFGSEDELIRLFEQLTNAPK